MDDPKLRMKAREDDAPAAPQFIALTPEQFAALAGPRQDSDEFLKKQAQYQAEATKRAMRPENEQHPGVSVFRPQGRDDTLQLKCKMFWVGFPLEADNLTAEEIALLNQVDAVGEFLFHKTDGSPAKFTITGEKNALGQWTRLLLHFSCRGSDRHNQPGMIALLREVLPQMAPVGVR